MNGKEVGVAATDIPNKIYGFVDLWNDYCPAVKLIPDVQEVRKVPKLCSETYLQFLPAGIKIALHFFCVNNGQASCTTRTIQ